LVTNLNVFISEGEKDSDMDPSTLVWEPISFHSMRSQITRIPLISNIHILSYHRLCQNKF